MTIKIERDAFLRVITRKGPLIEKLQQQPEEDEYVVVALPSKESHDFFYDDLLPALTSTEIEDDDDDDDQASLLSLSTDSTASTISTLDDQRRVTFAPELVTDVFTREKTLPEEVPCLYYTSMETQTFRQQYRFERKVINELSIDPEAFPEEELDELLAKASTSSTTSPTASVLGSPSSRHHISRVVVLHNDKLETFFNQEPQDDDSQGDDLLTSLISAPKIERASCVGSLLPTFPSDDFFDSDSFWTGSLTWY